MPCEPDHTCIGQYHHPNTSRSTVALPFCHARLTGSRPLDPAYPRELRTIGDHIRKRRLDLGLLQREAAEDIGVTQWTLRNWELGWSTPAIRCLPEIIRFLGYSPLPQPSSLSDQLLTHRKLRGISRQRLAQELGIDPGTLWRWESGKVIRAPSFVTRLRGSLPAPPARSDEGALPSSARSRT